MYGYESWNQLVQLAETNVATEWDGDVDPDLAEQRILRQVDILAGAGIPLVVAREIVGKVRPTEKSLGAKPAHDPAEPAAIAVDLIYEQALQAFSDKEYNAAHDAAIAVLHSRNYSAADKLRFFDLLRMLISHHPIAKANVALAMVYGDGTPKNVIEGGAFLREIVDHHLLPDHLRETVLNVLGDIARGAHGGGSLSRQTALDYYRRSAKELRSASGAFNAGEMLLQDNDVDGAAEMYKISADAGHPNGMLKFAIMMIEGEIEGDPDEVERLIRTSAALGHPLAKQVLPDMEMIKAGVEYANSMTALAMSSFRPR